MLCCCAIDSLSLSLCQCSTHLITLLVTLTIPIRAQFVTLQKYFPHPSLVVYSFLQPRAHKTETGTANRVKWELLIANHLDWTNHSDWPIKKQGAAVRSYLLHSSVTGAHSLAGAQRCCGFTSLRSKYAGEKLFS